MLDANTDTLSSDVVSHIPHANVHWAHLTLAQTNVPSVTFLMQTYIQVQWLAAAVAYKGTAHVM